MEWKYNEKDFIEIPKNMEGFVYLITNLTNNKKYVGKKHFWTRQKDRKTGRRKKKESDWRNYYGSCDGLKEDINLIGKEYFLREILYICAHKKSMSYYETYEQFNRNVLMTDEYYNTNIEGRFFVSERTGIYEVVLRNDKFRELVKDRMIGDNNPAKRPEVRQRLSEMFSGEGNPMYGSKLTDEHKEKLFLSRKKQITDGINTWDSVISYMKEKDIHWNKYIELIEKNKIFYVDGNPINLKTIKNKINHNLKLWECLITGYISTAAGLSIYQKNRNIDILQRKEFK
jgi:hypothetical protein